MGTLLRNISTLLTLEGAFVKQGRRVREADLGIIQKKSCIYFDRGRIQWFGPQQKLPKIYAKDKNIREWDLNGFTVLPGLVESHTHSVFAGHRADEFELRNQGVSYQEISARGGGILSTVKKTRSMPLDSLLSLAQKRVDRFVSQGVTTVEVKSGYALTVTGELKMLRVIDKLKGPRRVATFLGAHALPPEYSTYEEYLEFLAKKVLPLVKKDKLAERVDIFIEKGFFPLEPSRRFLEKAKALGFFVVIHADQMTLSGGSELAVELGALSADHVIQLKENQIQKLAESDITAVLLPSADLYTKMKYPPARALIDAGARVALATDFNPGTSPTQDINLVGLLARLEMKMTLPEVIGAYTIGAAHALNLSHEVGSVSIGKSADFLCTRREWTELFYSVGGHEENLVFSRGKKIFSSL